MFPSFQLLASILYFLSLWIWLLPLFLQRKIDSPPPTQFLDLLPSYLSWTAFMSSGIPYVSNEDPLFPRTGSSQVPYSQQYSQQGTSHTFIPQRGCFFVDIGSKPPHKAEGGWSKISLRNLLGMCHIGDAHAVCQGVQQNPSFFHCDVRLLIPYPSSVWMSWFILRATWYKRYLSSSIVCSQENKGTRTNSEQQV